MIADNRTQPAWWVESRAGDEAGRIEKMLARGLWVLETMVTAAPLLGLLGTITGMMQSFNVIGASTLVAPTQVTAGVAQALIATALGLLIAVVALFAFNFFSRLQSQALDTMERLGSRLVDRIRLDQETARRRRFRDRHWQRDEDSSGARFSARTNRDHPDDRRDVLSAGDVHAGVAVDADAQLDRGQPAQGQRRIDGASGADHADGHARQQNFHRQDADHARPTGVVLKPMLKTNDLGVVVNADTDSPEGTVVEAMIEARRAGVEKFLIAVKH